MILDRLFRPDEVAAWKAEIARVLPAEGGHRTNGVWVGVSAASPVIKAVNADPRIVEALRAVIGPDVEFLSDKLVFKANDLGFGTPWHQDWPYWHGAHKTSVWIALDDATPANGCLKLLPGSHVRAVAHGGDASDGRGFDNRLKPGEVDEARAVTAVAPAGTVVIFHDLTLHASHPNTSGADRWALISTYRNAAEPDHAYPWSVAAFMVCGAKTAATLGPEGRAKT